jgi:hypothetical protein
MDLGWGRLWALAQDFILERACPPEPPELLPSKALGLMRISAKEIDTRERAAPAKALLSCFLS